MEVVMQTASGQKHTERFFLLNQDGEPSQGGMNAFSYFAKTALNDFGREEIDAEELVGCFMRCEVDYEEVESNRTPGKMLKFVRLGDKEPADGFDDAKKDTPKQGRLPGKEPAQPTPGEGKKPKYDLGSLLGQ
jgi:glutaredoxin-related protein